MSTRLATNGNEPTYIVVQSQSSTLSIVLMMIVGFFSLMMTVLSYRQNKGTPMQRAETAVQPSPLNTALQNKLHDLLDDYFNEQELRDVCFDLGVDYEDLPCMGQANKARELVALCGRTGQLSKLNQIVKDLRRESYADLFNTPAHIIG